jgi:hypothetical protein
VPLQRFAKPEESAQVIVFLLSPSAAYVNGVVVPVDGGWSLVQLARAVATTPDTSRIDMSRRFEDAARLLPVHRTRRRICDRPE